MNTKLYACLVLPSPPSVNGLYAGKTRRYKSKAYRLWLHEAAMSLAAQRPIPRIEGKIQVRYSFSRKNHKADVFNFEKALSDFLVDHQVIEDDSLIERGVVEWSDEVENGARVEIEAC